MFSPDELLLRDAFHELRAVERVVVPRFVIGQARPAVVDWMRGLAAAMLAFIVIITFAIVLPRPATIPDPLTNWKAPTDFLLQTPQADLLRTVPKFGERTTIR